MCKGRTMELVRRDGQDNTWHGSGHGLLMEMLKCKTWIAQLRKNQLKRCQLQSRVNKQLVPKAAVRSRNPAPAGLGKTAKESLKPPGLQMLSMRKVRMVRAPQYKLIQELQKQQQRRQWVDKPQSFKMVSHSNCIWNLQIHHFLRSDRINFRCSNGRERKTEAVYMHKYSPRHLSNRGKLHYNLSTEEVQ